jgi:hypothetical protein
MDQNLEHALKRVEDLRGHAEKFQQRTRQAKTRLFDLGKMCDTAENTLQRHSELLRSTERKLSEIKQRTQAHGLSRGGNAPQQDQSLVPAGAVIPYSDSLSFASTPPGSPLLSSSYRAVQDFTPASPEAAEWRTAYLPVEVNGIRILHEEKINKWRVDNSLLRANSIGPGYYRSKNTNDRFAGNPCPKWGELISGSDESDGWVRCKIPIQAYASATPSSKSTGRGRRGQR